MSNMETIRARHSVRKYTDKPIEGEVLASLLEEIDEVSKESGLNIQFVPDNPEVYQVVARFGLIYGATASVAFVTKDKESDIEIGYWGQRIVLRAQELGLNTCWVALCNRKKSKAKRGDDEKVRLIVAIGYGENDGVDRKTKSVEELSTCAVSPMPSWFEAAMEAAQLAPTAMNAQNFQVELLEDGETVRLSARANAWRKVDQGIVKRNFEIAANEQGATWRWAQE